MHYAKENKMQNPFIIMGNAEQTWRLSLVLVHIRWFKPQIAQEHKS